MYHKRFHSYSDYLEVVTSMLKPLEKYCIHTSCGIRLPNEIQTTYNNNEARLEVFARSLLGVALVNNTRKTYETYFQKIKEGTNPQSCSFWGVVHDCSQTIVEMFPILLFCLKNIDYFKQSFSENEKANVQDWFIQINNIKVHDNNWHFFPILVNLFLKCLGFQYSENIIDREWKRIDEFYLGNGWYSDGKTKQRDYYIAFAFHFYSLLYALYSNDKSRNDIIVERAQLFARLYHHFFSENGASIPFGRSLTYKFAQVAFWSIYALFVKDRTELGIIKGIINRNLRWWLSQKIFDQEGILTNGYAYPNPYMLEQYNGSGSPYWAFKAFMFMLNPNALFFDVEELPLPERKQNIRIPEAYTSIHHTCGQSYAFFNGPRNDWFCQNTAKYEKFVYSSLFGFSVSRSAGSLEMIAPDNTLCIKINNNIIVRSHTSVVYNDDSVQISDWTPLPSLCIRSFVFTGAPWHTRIHYIITDTPVTLYDCGFALCADNAKEEIKNDYCVISNNSAVTAAFGEKTTLIRSVPNTNILYSQSVFPLSSKSFGIGIHIMSSAFYGNTNDKLLSKRPDITNIRIRNGRLAFQNREYILPVIPSYKFLKYKAYNTIRGLIS